MCGGGGGSGVLCCLCGRQRGEWVGGHWSGEGESSQDEPVEGGCAQLPATGTGHVGHLYDSQTLL